MRYKVLRTQVLGRSNDVAKTGNTINANSGLRRRTGFQRASGASRGMVEALAGKKGFAEADVLLRWPEIVGEAHRKICQPQAVRFSGARSVGATLVVETTSARATEVDHLAPVLIERVNQFYGYRAIGRLKVVQTAITTSGFAEEQAAFDGPDTDPTPTKDALRTAAELTRGIESEGLRKALTRMGAHVLASTKT